MTTEAKPTISRQLAVVRENNNGKPYLRIDRIESTDNKTTVTKSIPITIAEVNGLIVSLRKADPALMREHGQCNVNACTRPVHITTLCLEHWNKAGKEQRDKFFTLNKDLSLLVLECLETAQESER